MQLSVVIVNYNVRYFLEQALLSVRRAMTGMEVEVFVVDNNSQDGSVAMVRKRFPWVELIANQDNPGFSIANNQAIRRARGKYVLLLNPDTVVAEDTFRKCYEFCERGHVVWGGGPKRKSGAGLGGTVGALGVRMIDGTGRFLPESKRGLPTPWVAFTKAFGLAKLFPKSRRFGQYHLGYLGEREINPVTVLAGAFMWVRKSAIDEVGLLDETFFMYGEDIDWSYRIEQGGYTNYYFPETSIIHYKGESTKRGSLNYVRVFYQAMIIFARKHFTGSQAKLLVGMMQAAVYLRALLTVLANTWRALRFSLVDGVGVYIGLRVIKHLWASYHFGDPSYFAETINYVHFPGYTLLWLACVFLSGGYERPYDLGRLLKSLGVGTLVLFAIYGLLPEYYRPSRALLLLGAAWAATWMLLVRTVSHLVAYRNLNFTTDRPARLLIVGSVAETDRALSLLQRAGARRNYLGRIAVGEERKTIDAVGQRSNLLELVELYRAGELLFCSRDLSYQQIEAWMSALGPAVRYQILPEASNSIIGSQGKDRLGTLYTVDVRYQLDEPVHRRAKWLFDRGVALLALLLLPLHIWFSWSTRFSPRNILKVLLGRKTWVGYASKPSVTERLPALRPGVITTVGSRGAVGEETQKHLDALYARDYHVGLDFRRLFLQ